eukprot:jgi/Botrbrau1/12417/Bobra.0229s0013.1
MHADNHGYWYGGSFRDGSGLLTLWRAVHIMGHWDADLQPSTREPRVPQPWETPTRRVNAVQGRAGTQSATPLARGYPVDVEQGRREPRYKRRLVFPPEWHQSYYHDGGAARPRMPSRKQGEAAHALPERGQSLEHVPLPRPRKRQELHGPCSYCKAADSPQWRKGPADQPVLCNACGTRWLRKNKLEKVMKKVIEKAPRCSTRRPRRTDESGSLSESR